MQVCKNEILCNAVIASVANRSFVKPICMIGEDLFESNVREEFEVSFINPTDCFPRKKAWSQ